MGLVVSAFSSGGGVETRKETEVQDFGKAILKSWKLRVSGSEGNITCSGVSSLTLLVGDINLGQSPWRE